MDKMDEGRKQEALDDLREKVFMTLGAVSMCWSETPKGVFEDSKALRFGNDLMREIERKIDLFIED